MGKQKNTTELTCLMKDSLIHYVPTEMMRNKWILEVEANLKVLWSTLGSLQRNKENPRRVNDAANASPVCSGPGPSGS